MRRKQYRPAKKAATVDIHEFPEGKIWSVTPMPTAHGSIDFESEDEIREFAEELKKWVSKNIKDK